MRAMRAISYSPITHRIRKRLLSTPSIAEKAIEIMEICPVETGEKPAALYLQGQLEKVRSVQEETNEFQERSRIVAGTIKHEATIAYNIKQAAIINGVVYCDGARVQKVYERENLLPHHLKQHIGNIAIASSVIGNRYFGHFIAEDACTGMMAKDFSQVAWVQTEQPRSDHALRYLDIYQLPYREIRTAYLDNAWLFQDFAMNSHKRKRMAIMRQKIRQLPGKNNNHKVFFRRRGSGVHRGFVNEQDIEETLAKQGFTIIDVTCESADSIIEKTKDAAIVMGVEGSALMHGILSMSPEGALICIQPPYRFNNVLKDHTDAIGLHYGFVVGEGTKDSFTVDERELLQTVDFIQSVI